MNSWLECLFGSGIIIALVGIIAQNREIYINNISVKRSESNNELREAISKIIAYCMLNNKNNNDEDYESKISEYKFYQSVAIARMHLSIHPERVGNAGHDLLNNKLKEIQDIKKINCNTAEEILFLTRQILDYEWSRVKKEAKGEI